MLLEDWLPSLERAAQWNGWSMQDRLIQLPGYLKDRALQEWHLLGREEQQSYSTAVSALQSRLDPRNRTMAAQEFRHSMQCHGESAAEFIRRLEKAYQVAYGKDSLNKDTRDALLYGQLYEGLRYELMRAPTVSGTKSYQELCVAAKGEEHRLAALRQRQQYKPQGEPSSRTPRTNSGQSGPRGPSQDSGSAGTRKAATPDTTTGAQVICYNCGKPGHLAKNCRQHKQESKGRFAGRTGLPQTKQVHSKTQQDEENAQEQDVSTPESLLYSESDDEGSSRAYAVCVSDKGSISQCVKVQVQGVPAYGLLDTGADITIIGGRLFKRVATVARLKKPNLKKADKTPRTYDQKTFKLDGRMNLNIAFEGKTMCTPVYFKMDAADQLLLSEGVCRQLGVVTYHQKVEKWRGHCKKQRAPQLSQVLKSSQWCH